MGFKQMLLAVLALVLVVGGCAPDRINPPDRPGPRPNPVIPGPGAPVAPPPADVPDNSDPTTIRLKQAPFKPTYSDAEKQKIVQESLLGLQRVLVCTDELAVLSTGKTSASVVKDSMTDKLTALTFKVVQSSKQLSFSPSEREQDAFRESAKCNLAFVAAATVRKADKFGKFWSFTGDVRGKVLNLTTHQIIASKNFTKRGKRGLDEAMAARSALESASKDLVTYLTDEVVRQWEATSLVRMVLVATNIDNVRMADDIRVGLQRRVGIHYVSLDSWDSDSQVAVYEILCRFDVQRFLAAYVDEVRGKGRVKVKSITRSGKVIKMERKNMG